ncbi:hypothetical protein E2C01_023725 [Portunus trituberculatus]|uniref:Uncharacterized protein n=1 Tax=Portunus trituberculatus TaxID=210409 RepID=A0A5B7E9W7_PORTR|nr:hypothetical protein [Portunus trituberculatus]
MEEREHREREGEGTGGGSRLLLLNSLATFSPLLRPTSPAPLLQLTCVVCLWLTYGTLPPTLHPAITPATYTQASFYRSSIPSRTTLISSITRHPPSLLLSFLYLPPLSSSHVLSPPPPAPPSPAKIRHTNAPPNLTLAYN